MVALTSRSSINSTNLADISVYHYFPINSQKNVKITDAHRTITSYKHIVISQQLNLHYFTCLPPSFTSQALLLHPSLLQLVV